MTKSIFQKHRKFKIKLVGFLILLLFSCGNKPKSLTDEVTSPEVTKLEKRGDSMTILSIEKLNYIKTEIAIDSETYKPAYEALIESADKALSMAPFSVTHKIQTPESGDKRDYMSIGPYWWPDPKSSNGLPWIRRDGEVNPSTLGNDLDLTRKNNMFRYSYRLAMAHYFSENEKYAEKAKELLSVWFLNEKTRMKPNLDYAQAIPGKTIGRGIGIIEFTGVKELISTIELLELNNIMGTEMSNGLRKWLKDYLHWLQNSKNGIKERNWPNNHGTWYDVQVVSILLFLDRYKDAEHILETSTKGRIESQIEKDGTLPLELERTRPLHYSIYNLEAFTYLAFFGKKLGLNLLDYQSKESGNIQDAYDYLFPYVTYQKEWELKDIVGVDESLDYARRIFLMAGNMFGIEEYTAIGMRSEERDNFKIIGYSFQ